MDRYSARRDRLGTSYGARRGDHAPSRDIEAPCVSLPNPARLHIDHPQLLVATAGRTEHQVPRIGRPSRILVLGIAGQLVRRLIAQRHRENLKHPGAVGHVRLIRDGQAVRRPVGVRSVILRAEPVCREHTHVRPVRIHNINLGRASSSRRKGNSVAVGAEARRAVVGASTHRQALRRPARHRRTVQIRAVLPGHGVHDRRAVGTERWRAHVGVAAAAECARLPRTQVVHHDARILPEGGVGNRTRIGAPGRRETLAHHGYGDVVSPVAVHHVDRVVPHVRDAGGGDAPHPGDPPLDLVRHPVHGQPPASRRHVLGQCELVHVDHLPVQHVMQGHVQPALGVPGLHHGERPQGLEHAVVHRAGRARGIKSTPDRRRHRVRDDDHVHPIAVVEVPPQDRGDRVTVGPGHRQHDHRRPHPRIVGQRDVHPRPGRVLGGERHGKA